MPNETSSINDTEYFSHLYEIARYLNKEFSLHSALRKALEKTIELLHLDTGWIWLEQEGTQSVYLAASFNLPPALSQHPERLSGQCYCINRYLANEIAEAQNISEITCSRLKNIKSGTRKLKFHATIPITINERKVGLINLVSKTSQKLNDKQLCILNTVSELISIAIQRTQSQSSHGQTSSSTEASLREVLSRIIHPELETLVTGLKELKGNYHPKTAQNSLDQAEELYRQLSMILGETWGQNENTEQHFHYPTSPLSNREMETLTLVKQGLTNKQIAERLFISERTVKFHMTSIFSKLFAQTRTEAVETAIKRGLL